MRRATILWIGVAVWLNCAGWFLSLLHQLNPVGWLGVLILGFCLAGFWLNRLPLVSPPGSVSIAKLRRRFCRLLPVVFLLLTTLIVAGGVLYAPSNYDALTYRLPRMLNWQINGAWCWIATINSRMNCANTVWEWMAMPLLSLTRSDRAFFLINVSAFLLLPGLLFSLFRQLGVARRVAWTWMWVLPLAYGYATQAGGVGNDLLGAVFGLVSLVFGLRARRTKDPTDIWVALLAAALMTGVKVSNAPLALPCLVAVWPALGQLWRVPLRSLVLALVALMVSAAPTMVLNQVYTHNWTGDPTNEAGMQIKNPVAGLLGNGLLVTENAFLPPVLPVSAANDRINRHLPASWTRLLARDYPRYRLYKLNELPTEEGAGIGLGVTLLLLAGAASTSWAGKGLSGFRLSWVVVAGWLAAMVYLLKIGSEAAPRLMLPYYPLLLLPFLLLPGQQWWLQRRVGRVCAVLAALGVLPALILSPLRPLWPGQTVCEKLTQQHPGQHVFVRMATTYSAYSHRNDVLAPLRAGLPGDVRRVGFVAGGNDTDYSLWRPFGQRQVVYLTQDPQAFLAHPDCVDWLAVKAVDWTHFFHVPLDEWAQTNGFHVVVSTNIVELVSWGGENWQLLHRQNN